MKKFLFSAITLVAFNSHATSTPPEISDSTASVGVSAGISVGPYRNYSNKVTPLPMIAYEGSNFFIRGAKSGLKLYDSKSDEISLSASLLPFSFKPKDAERDSLKNLNERKHSAIAGLSWIHNADWGFTSVTAGQRITGNKKGVIMTAEYGYPFQLGDTTLLVSTGLEYNNSEMNKNYFGISSEESIRSGLRRYNPGSGVSPYLDLLATYPLTNSVDISAGARLTRLSDAIYNSPMVDDRYMKSFFSSISYNF
ncbi:MipA/OmpV family protein [Pectobacterium punjabense]|uniref:MipA/OmpV family protein n=1 Tax=Pectobacterium punjabense TaxID=2108399 RepID=UPI003120305E